jgi:hypothetical protein
VATTTFLVIGDYVYICSAADCSTGDPARITAIDYLTNTVTLDVAVTGGSGFPVLPVVPYVISYSNTGNASATGVVLTDPIPAGMTYVASDPAYSSSPPPTWNLGTLAPGEGGTVKLWLLPTAVDLYTNTATIDSTETAPASDSAQTGIGALEPSKQETVVTEPVVNTWPAALRRRTPSPSSTRCGGGRRRGHRHHGAGIHLRSTQSSLVDGVPVALTPRTLRSAPTCT